MRAAERCCRSVGDKPSRGSAEWAQPCVRGVGLTVRRVVEAVAIYANRDDLFRNYPELEPEDVRQALAFAATSVEDSRRKVTRREAPFFSYSFDCNEPEHVHVQRENRVCQCGSSQSRRLGRWFLRAGVKSDSR
jgi:uncharacterized protein (DUF433 family)